MLRSKVKQGVTVWPLLGPGALWPSPVVGAPRLVPLGIRISLRLLFHNRTILFLLFLCRCPACGKLPGQPSPANPQSLFPKVVVTLMSALNLRSTQYPP